MYSFNAEAPCPDRSNGSFTLGFGVISIPLSLYAGSEEVRVTRKEFIDGDTNRPAGRAVIDKSSGAVVDSSSVVRMAEATSGAWVVLTDDEIAACSVPKQTAEIITFVPWALTNQYLPEDVVQVRPRSVKGKTNPIEVKAFSLFLQTLARSEVVALVRYGTRAGVQYGLLTHAGDLVKIKTSDQVRARMPLAVPECSEGELAMAEQLVKAIGIGAPSIVNETAREVQAFVNEKASGIEVPKPSPVMPDLCGDLTALLAKSLAAKAA